MARSKAATAHHRRSPDGLRGPVRLLLVNPSPHRGGAEESLLEFLTRADPTKVVTTVACLADGSFTDDLEEAGARVVHLRAQRLRYPHMWARTVLRLAGLARQHDVVLSWQVKGHYYGTPAARLARTPVAWWDHGIRPAKGEARYAIDNLLPATVRADLVVTSSAASGARHRRNRVILPGIPLEPYAAPDRETARMLLEVDPSDKVIGIVGRLQPWKGQHVLLRAMPDVLARFPEARLVVIGDAIGGFSAGYPAELRAIAADRKIDHRVRFFGQRDDVPALLPGLDVAVMASVAEPFGLVTVEAMAAGVPVVATRTGGTPEIVTDGVDGVLVPPGDAGALAHGIIEVLSEPARAATMAAAGRSRAFAAFDIKRYVSQIEDLVTELRR